MNTKTDEKSTEQALFERCKRLEEDEELLRHMRSEFPSGLPTEMADAMEWLKTENAKRKSR